MQDRFGRVLKTLRVSVTDRCDLRCLYCMPAEGMKWTPNEELLSPTEFSRAVGLLVEGGVTRLKLTGGEPLRRPDLEQLIAGVSGLQEISLTTNGTRLAGRAKALKAAGLQRVTVSLDSLNPASFARLTRGGDVAKVWAGLEAAEAAGLGPIKINAVVLDQPMEELVQLARLTLTRGWHVRFIEYMPVTGLLPPGVKPLHTPAQLRAAIEAGLGALSPEAVTDEAAPALLFKVPGAVGHLGFINALTENFCSRCDRLRLAADGKLVLCMAHADHLDLRALLRGGADDRQLRGAIAAAVWMKPAGHDYLDRPAPLERSMSRLGG
jgi:cyclic pyranopterin phosphate synthase